MELTLEPVRIYRNKKTGRYMKGHPSPVKGKKWDDFLTKEQQERILENLRKAPKPRHITAGWNKRAVMMITKEGKSVYFPSAEEAKRVTGINAGNICSCCRGERKHAGGCEWYWYDSNGWINKKKQR